MTDVLIVFCTCPNASVAEQLAGALVENHFAACVNILPDVRSIYRWQDELHNDGEALMVMKTTKDAYPALEAWLQENHPYDVPEILAVPVSKGSGGYLDWVKDQCQLKQ